MNKMKRKELWGRILTIALAFVIAPWIMFGWTAATGLTFATRSARGRPAAEEDRQRVRHIAVLSTVFAGPVALWSAMMRKRVEE